MKWLVAGLTFVNFSTLTGLVLGTVGHGLGTRIAAISFILGALFAAAAFVQTSDPEKMNSAGGRWHKLPLWILGTCFALFAIRSFCWLIYIEGDQFRIQSPYNLGDLALHITYIRNFASGVPLWPDNPIYVFSKLRYPAGIDIFNSLLLLANVDLIRGLVWVGLLASIATCYAFWRWGGGFGIAGFLFNGGLIGFQVIKEFKFLDYQGDQTIAWKSIPLTMFVTQRGLLYAIPAGLLLLWHWREKFWPNHSAVNAGADDSPPGEKSGAPFPQRKDGPLPFWVELSLYASMPLFHFHTFLALTIVIAVIFVLECWVGISDLFYDAGTPGAPPLTGTQVKTLFANLTIGRHFMMLVGGALVPATLFVWLITDHFNAGSVVGWELGWVQALKGDALARPFFSFWFINFGLWMPLILVYLGFVWWRTVTTGFPRRLPAETALLTAAVIIFLMVFFFKLAPWGWDNTKLLIWAYFIVLPLLWRGLIVQWSIPIRVALCIALFGSGFVSLVGGLAVGRPGFGFANRLEVDAVGDAVRTCSTEARFAGYPTYNHPLLLQGRRMVMGYPGHLWTQGFADYGETEKQLRELMRGAKDWRETARKLGVRYIFWGRGEETNYPMSTRPWQRTALRVASDKEWGAIYDLEPDKTTKD